MATALTSAYTRFTDKCNKVLAGGVVKTFEPNTLTPKITYQDPEGVVPNLPEVKLDATGRARIFLLGDYRIQVYSNDGVLIEDNLYVDQNVTQSDFQEVNKTLIANVDSISDLETLEKWDGRTVYVKDIGSFRYDLTTNTWLNAYQDADNVKYGDQTQKQLNDFQNNLNLTIINYVNPKMFGAIGDGIADDAQAIRDCFNFMVANKATLNDFSYSKYRYNSNILVSAPNQKLIINGNCEFISENNYITFSGTKVQLGYVSSAVAKNSKTITLNQNAVLNKGDLIGIHNSRVSSLSTHRVYYYDGEYKTVEASTGNIITLESITETSYPGGVEDKVWKVNPITLDIRGVKFTSSGLSAIKISLCSYCYFDFNSENPSLSGGSQNSFNLDRAYSSYVAGGRHVKTNLSGSGTDYGLVIGNSQDVLVEADYLYGARHACSLGGDNTDMAVPNRRVYCEKMTLENSPASLLHAADMHGNSIDCHYRDNFIKGRISLSGYDPKSINNKIHVHPGDVRVPIGLSELIGGRVESISDEVVTSGGASYVSGWLSSSTIVNASKPVTLVLQDIKFEGNSNMVGILSAFNLPVSSNLIVDGFELVGDAPIFDRLVNYSAGTSLVKPAFIQITRPKYAVSENIILIAGDAGLA
ncbi:MAG: hypothetical protein AAGE79_03930, partial [Acinetobacter pittii]